jgi:APA family basic amino acid/polyamine antiporter
VGAVPYVQALVPLPEWFAAAVPAAILLSLGAMNYAGSQLNNKVMTALNWLKIPVLAALVGWALVSGRATLANLEPITMRRAGSDQLMAAIAGAAISAFFCFGGWWEAGKIAGEVRDPRRTLPIAFTGGVLVVTAIYLMVSFAFVAVVPMGRFRPTPLLLRSLARRCLELRAGECCLPACCSACWAG